jgi:hypothetical protein
VKDLSPLARVDDDCHCVESVSKPITVLEDPSAGSLLDLHPLPPRNPLQWIAGTRARQRLYFDESDNIPFLDHQIDLSVPSPPIPV